MRCRRRPRGLLWPSGGDVETRIADIVGAGFRRWAEFTERFTENEARIRTIDPGAAQWQDLRSLLERSCGAEQGPSATCPIFTLSDYGVDVTHSNVRTLNVFRGTFVCDETEGLPAEDATGRVLQRIGTAYPDVVDAIRSKISELPDDRIGSVRLQRSDQPGWPSPGPSIVLAYALQRIELVGGGAEEREIRLEVFVLPCDDRPRAVPHATVGKLVRQICAAERQATPDAMLLTKDLIDVDAELIETMRRKALEGGDVIPVVAIWPIACFAVAVN